MAHVFEPAPTGRAKCRGCAKLIPKGELRFGERMPSPFGEGEMTLWFHPLCAAYRRPESVLQALAESSEGVAARETLERAARGSAAHRRLARVDGAQRAPNGRAKCRSCRVVIPNGAWRVRLVFFEAGRFLPGGFLHVDCHRAYFEGHDALESVVHFSPDLTDEERGELTRAWGAAPDPPK